MEESSHESQNPLLGFLFGNVDEENRVDADYLDEVGPLAFVRRGVPEFG